MKRAVIVHVPGFAPWRGTLSDEHPATTYGVPLLIDNLNTAWRPGDLPSGTRLELKDPPPAGMLHSPWCDRAGWPIDP